MKRFKGGKILIRSGMGGIKKNRKIIFSTYTNKKDFFLQFLDFLIYGEENNLYRELLMNQIDDVLKHHTY
jgi:hypothetical protein